MENQDILRLEVTMNDAIVVQVCNAIEYLHKDILALLEGKRHATQQIVEATILIVAHHRNIRLTIQILECIACIVVRNIGVVELRCHLNLPL